MLKKARAEAERAAKPAGREGDDGSAGEPQGRDLADAVLESSRQIWLAGLGAFSRAKGEGVKLFETLVQQGQALETRTRSAAVDTAAAARDAAQAKARSMHAKAGGTWDKLEQVFEERGIGADQLPKAVVEFLPLDQKAEADRAARVERGTGPASPGLVRDTTEVLFRDLWLRPDLAPRDRSLVTVSALISAGQVEQIPYHLNRAMDNGLPRAEASEVISHLAYYAGWPNAFSAAPVARSVFEKRTN